MGFKSVFKGLNVWRDLKQKQKKIFDPVNGKMILDYYTKYFD
jgi:hypothetical protein